MSNAAKQQLIRLNKFLASKGYGSRREANALVANGFVKVNGETATIAGLRIDPATDVLKVDPAAFQFPKTTVIFHKPLGIVSCQPERENQVPAVSQLTAENYHLMSSYQNNNKNNNNHNNHGDQQHGENNAALSSSIFKSNHPHKREPFRLEKMAVAGRLDVNSTGLLVLTQCGQTAAQIIGPDSQLQKEYLVRVTQPIVEEVRPGVERKRPDPYFDLTQGMDDFFSNNDTIQERAQQIRERLEQLRQGVECTGDFLQLESVDILNEQQLKIVLRHGQKHHIRRMLAAVGWEVRALKRVRIGNLTLGNLPKGKWRYLGADESVVAPPAKEENSLNQRNRASKPFANRRNNL